MFNLFFLWSGALARAFRSRRHLVLENLALRQQLTVLKRRHPRPMLSRFDKLFWVMAHRIWSAWKETLIVVTPETVARWHRSGFRFYWRLISWTRKPAGRRRLSKEVRDLIFRMVAENSTWERRGYTENSSCSVLISPRERSPGGCAAHPEIPNEPSDGWHSCGITGEPSPRWASSPCRR